MAPISASTGPAASGRGHQVRSSGSLSNAADAATSAVLCGRERRRARQARADASVVPLARLGRAGADLRFGDERVEPPPIGLDEAQPGLFPKPLPHGAELLPGHVEDAQVAQSARLVHVGGDERELAAGALAHEPHEPISLAVDRGHEALDRGPERRLRRGGRDLGLGHDDAVLAEAIEHAPDLTTMLAIGGAVLGARERGREAVERRLGAGVESQPNGERACVRREIAHDGLSGCGAAPAAVARG
jgi:hypothetical protein